MDTAGINGRYSRNFGEQKCNILLVIIKSVFPQDLYIKNAVFFWKSLDGVFDKPYENGHPLCFLLDGQSVFTF